MALGAGRRRKMVRVHNPAVQKLRFGQRCNEGILQLWYGNVLLFRLLSQPRVPKQSNVERRRGNVYSRWREKILEKNPACVVCGSTTNLEVHHIIPVEFSPELVLCETNGITLCRDCPKMVHNTHRKNSKKE